MGTAANSEPEILPLEVVYNSLSDNKRRALTLCVSYIIELKQGLTPIQKDAVDFVIEKAIKTC